MRTLRRPNDVDEKAGPRMRGPITPVFHSTTMTCGSRGLSHGDICSSGPVATRRGCRKNEFSDRDDLGQLR